MLDLFFQILARTAGSHLVDDQISSFKQIYFLSLVCYRWNSISRTICLWQQICMDRFEGRERYWREVFAQLEAQVRARVPVSSPSPSSASPLSPRALLTSVLPESKGEPEIVADSESGQSITWSDRKPRRDDHKKDAGNADPLGKSRIQPAVAQHRQTTPPKRKHVGSPTHRKGDSRIGHPTTLRIKRNSRVGRPQWHAFISDLREILDGIQKELLFRPKLFEFVKSFLDGKAYQLDLKTVPEQQQFFYFVLRFKPNGILERELYSHVDMQKLKGERDAHTIPYSQKPLTYHSQGRWLIEIDSTSMAEEPDIWVHAELPKTTDPTEIATIKYVITRRGTRLESPARNGLGVLKLVKFGKGQTQGAKWKVSTTFAKQERSRNQLRASKDRDSDSGTDSADSSH